MKVDYVLVDADSKEDALIKAQEWDVCCEDMHSVEITDTYVVDKVITHLNG